MVGRSYLKSELGFSLRESHLALPVGFQFVPITFSKIISLNGIGSLVKLALLRFGCTKRSFQPEKPRWHRHASNMNCIGVRIRSQS